MANRLVKTAYVLYTPATPAVVGRPAYCVTVDTPEPGSNGAFGTSSTPDYRGGYWVDGTPESASDPEYGAGW